ncbi:MAG: hypothetical protein ACI4XM_02195 [Candidatus Coprovivens sp.]
MKKLFYLLITFFAFITITNAKGCQVISGNGFKIGDEIACGSEHFYVMSNDGTYVKMLAKYNLLVGTDYLKIELDNIEGTSSSVVFTDSKVQEAIKNGYYHLYNTNCTISDSIYTCDQAILTRSSTYSSKVIFFEKPISSIHEVFKSEEVQEIFDDGYKYNECYSYNNLIYGISFINENTNIYDYKTVVFDKNSRITYSELFKKEEVKKLLEDGYIFSKIYGESYYTCGNESECSTNVYAALLYKDSRYEFVNIFANTIYKETSDLIDYLTNNVAEYNQLLEKGYYLKNYIYTPHSMSGSNIVYTSDFTLGLVLQKKVKNLNLYNLRQNELAIGAHGSQYGKPEPEEIGVISSALIWGKYENNIIYDEGYIDAYFDEDAGYYLNSYYDTLINDGYDIEDVIVPSVGDLNELAFKLTEAYLPLSKWWYEWEENYSDMLNNKYYIVGSIKDYIPEEYSWIWSTTYWTRTWDPDGNHAYFVDTLGNLCSAHYCNYIVGAGLRPLVTISANDLLYKIETKTDGNGSIETITESKAGKGVTFVVTPNEGYTLKEVKVTDANGNVLTFKDYTFTMPDSNVLIEATFEVESPPTTTANITIAIILICISLIIILKYKTKGKWLNN